jgi:hypothetical protein
MRSHDLSKRSITIPYLRWRRVGLTVDSRFKNNQFSQLIDEIQSRPHGTNILCAARPKSSGEEIYYTYLQTVHRASDLDSAIRLHFS